MIALAPSLIIPLMFSIRSSVVDKCASKIARCVTFARNEEKYNHNPLSAYHYSSSSASGTSGGSGSRNKSPLFYIDEFSRKAGTPYHLHQPSQHQLQKQQQKHQQQQQQQQAQYQEGGISHKLNFFVPKYLPTDHGHHHQTESIPTIAGSDGFGGPISTGTSGGAPKSGRYVKQGSQKHSKQHKSSSNNNNAPSSSSTSQHHQQNQGSSSGGALKNFRAYINRGYRNDRNEHVYTSAGGGGGGGGSGNNSNDELVTKGNPRGAGDGTDDTDSQCGFPIPSPPPSQNAIYASHYYSRLNIDGGQYGYR